MKQSSFSFWRRSFCSLFLVAGAAAVVPHLGAQTTQPNPNPIDIPMIPAVTEGTFAEPSRSFLISEKSITPTEYCAFLNAVASTGMPADRHHLYHFEWFTHPAVSCIQRTGTASTGFHYSVLPGTKTLKITEEVIPNSDTALKFISMADAARFCNWLQNGQPIGEQGDTTTEKGSYTFAETENVTNPITGAVTQKDLLNVYKGVTRQEGAVWRLPTRQEWAGFFACYNNLDYSEKLWNWTEDSYFVNPAHQNFGGYYRATCAQRLWTDHDYFFQTVTLVDTSFRVVKTQ